MLTGRDRAERNVALLVADRPRCQEGPPRELLCDCRSVDLDSELLDYAASPAELGAKRVRVSDACVARHMARRRGAPERPEHVKLRLRQRLETGRFRRSEPVGFPTDLRGRWDGYVLAAGLIFCLRRTVEHARSFEADTCFETDSLEQSLCCADDYDSLAEADVIVEVPAHAVERYMERVRSGIEFARARKELSRLIVEHATLLPELPGWFVGACREDAPAYLTIDEWLVIPLRFRDQSALRYVAVTCLGRGLNELRNAQTRQAKRAKRGAQERQGPATRRRSRRTRPDWPL